MVFLTGWKRLLLIIAAFDLVMLIANFAAAFSFGFQLRSSASWLFGSSDKETFGSLLFIEGAILIGIGALIAGGFSESRTTSPHNNPSAPYKVEKLSEQRPEFRKKQTSTGFLMMFVGVPLIVITILLLAF